MTNCIDKFNSLDGTAVNRNSLTELVSLAKFQGRNDIAARLSNLLTNDKSKEFAISLTEKAIGEIQSNLNGIDFIVGDDEGLGEPVSPDEIYQYITDLVIKLIESDKELAWRKPWTPKLSTPNGSLATNFSSKKAYRGINRIMLNLIIPMALGKTWDNPYFLTFKQIKEHKGQLKKGSSGYRVIYFTNLYSFSSPNEKISIRTYNKSKFIAQLKKSGANILKGMSASDVADQSLIPILKYYNVFNADDIDGIVWGVKPAIVKSKTEQIDVAEAIVLNMPKAPKVFKGDKEAYYMPQSDKVGIPSIDSFKNPQAYYSTLFHELVHSTKHSKRLNDTSRGGKKKGDKEYAREELVAELGASFLNGEAGILFHTLKNSAAYLKGWRKKLLTFLKEDNRFFFRASSKSQAAADYILDRDKKGVPAYVGMLASTNDLVKETKKQKSVKKKTEQLVLFGLSGLSKSSDTIKFNKQILKAAKKGYLSTDIFILGAPKNVLKKHINNHIISLSGRVLTKIMAQTPGHKLNWANLLDLPDYLNSPQAIFKSKTKGYVVLTEVLNFEKKPVLIALHVNNKYNVTNIASAYAKNNTNVYKNWIKEKLHLYVNEKSELFPYTQAPIAVGGKNSQSKDKQKTKSNNNKLEGLGFVSAAAAPSEAKDIFRLAGTIGSFVQDVQPHQALILIKGTKHTSKSQLAMQMAEGFSLTGRKVAYIDYEQGGLESKDTLNSLSWNTTEKGKQNIFVKGYIDKPMEELINLIDFVDVIVADSVTDLGISADELNFLRKTYPKTIWCFISQVKENGSMYGGNKMAHNPTAIIDCHPANDPKGRYATLEKNRGNDLSICYDIYKKKTFVFTEDKNGNKIRKYEK